jgi:hypothetical protein
MTIEFVHDLVYFIIFSWFKVALPVGVVYAIMLGFRRITHI